MSAVQLPLCIAPAPSPNNPCALASTPLPENQPSPCQPPCQQLVDARLEAGRYKSLHQRARQREERLKLQVAQLQAENRDLQHRLFGRSSEVHYTHNSLPTDDQTLNHSPANAADDSATLPATLPEPATPRRPRGQQRGAPGHGR